MWDGGFAHNKNFKGLYFFFLFLSFLSFLVACASSFLVWIHVSQYFPIGLLVHTLQHRVGKRLLLSRCFNVKTRANSGIMTFPSSTKETNRSNYGINTSPPPPTPSSLPPH